MTASAKLIQIEAKLFVRDPIGLFFGLVFPTALLLLLGSLYPGFDEPAADLGGDRYIDVYSPVALILGLVGMTIYLPSLCFAGVWIPRTVMSDGLVTVSDLTPFGSAVQALEDSWFGVTPSFSNLAVMAVWAILVGFLAVKLFRWD